MKICFGILSAFVILAILSLGGTVSAAQDIGNPSVGAAHFVPRPSDDLNAPAPVPGDSNWTRNWSGNATRDGNGNGECDGILGPDSPFYGLKLGFEDLDEAFTFNGTERIEKQIRHGDNRLLELECDIDRNQTRNLDRILERYWEKMNQTEDSLRPFPANDTGLLHAREMIRKHEGILRNLSEQNPYNQGLAKAYNNSLNLQKKFDEKIRLRYNLSAEGNITAGKQNSDKGQNKVNTGNDKVPPGQQKHQDQQVSGTAGNQAGGNSQKDKNEPDQSKGNGKNRG